MSAAEKKAAKDKFIEVLTNTANVREAATAAGVDHSTVYRWVEKDKKFKARFDTANESANWLLFGAAWKWALEGEAEVVVSGGKIVYEEEPVPDENGQPTLDKRGNPLMRPVRPMIQKKKSAQLLQFLMRNRIPEFRDKQDVNHTGLADLIAGAHQSLLNDLADLPPPSPEPEVVPADADQNKEQGSSPAADPA